MKPVNSVLLCNKESLSVPFTNSSKMLLRSKNKKYFH